MTEECKWCHLRASTCELYGWPTCQTCKDGTPKDRVNAWLKHARPKREARP